MQQLYLVFFWSIHYISLFFFSWTMYINLPHIFFEHILNLPSFFPWTLILNLPHFFPRICIKSPYFFPGLYTKSLSIFPRICVKSPSSFLGVYAKSPSFFFFVPISRVFLLLYTIKVSHLFLDHILIFSHILTFSLF